MIFYFWCNLFCVGCNLDKLWSFRYLRLVDTKTKKSTKKSTKKLKTVKLKNWNSQYFFNAFFGPQKNMKKIKFSQIIFFHFSPSEKVKKKILLFKKKVKKIKFIQIYTFLIYTNLYKFFFANYFFHFTWEIAT